MFEILSAIGCSLFVIIVSRVLSGIFPVKLFAATNLVAIAFIYVGFALKDNPASLLIIECAVAIVFYFIALVGYSFYPKLIAVGIIAHGIWDILHHHPAIVPTAIPGYWPLFCIIVDIITGLYFWIILKPADKPSQVNVNTKNIEQG